MITFFLLVPSGAGPAGYCLCYDISRTREHSQAVIIPACVKIKSMVEVMAMKIINTKQAAEILKVDQSRIRQLILRGKLPAQKIGRDWAILEKDLKLVAVRPLGRPPGKKSRKRAKKASTSQGDNT